MFARRLCRKKILTLLSKPLFKNKSNNLLQGLLRVERAFLFYNKIQVMKTRIFLPGLLVILSIACGTDTAQRPASDDASGEVSFDKSAILQTGKEIAQVTFLTLSTELAAAMERGGVTEAVNYCNLAAYPLVDSLSTVHNAKIRRTTLKPRNPKDAPNAMEKAVLEAYHQQERAGEALKPQIVQIGEREVAFFAPIRIQPGCLKCHGEIGKDITPEDYAHIEEHYPEDQAVGYELGELRGMWSIRIKK